MQFNVCVHRSQPWCNFKYNWSHECKDLLSVRFKVNLELCVLRIELDSFVEEIDTQKGFDGFILHF